MPKGIPKVIPPLTLSLVLLCASVLSFLVLPATDAHARGPRFDAAELTDTNIACSESRECPREASFCESGQCIDCCESREPGNCRKGCRWDKTSQECRNRNDHSCVLGIPAPAPTRESKPAKDRFWEEG